MNIPPEFKLIIFDKDGTLLDFHAMWGGWAADSAARLAAAAQTPISAALLAMFGYDAQTGKVDPHGRLAHAPMSVLYAASAAILLEAGLPETAVNQIMTQNWRVPDPAADAAPITNLPRLFAALKKGGCKLASPPATTAPPPLASLTSLGLTSYVDAIVGGDEGFAPKPSPEMIHQLCRQLGVPPAQTIMVGDTPADAQMGRAANVGLTIGVLSGVGDGAALRPFADLILPHVGHLNAVNAL